MMMMQSSTTTNELISNASSSVNPTGVIATAEVADVSTVVTATKVIESEPSSDSSSITEVESVEGDNVEPSSVPKSESTEVAPNANTNESEAPLNLLNHLVSTLLQLLNLKLNLPLKPHQRSRRRF